MTRSLFDSPAYVPSGNADEAYAETLSRLLDHGAEVTGGESLSVGSGKKCHELLNFTVVLDSPRDRLIFNEARRLNLPAAVARFLWMMAGSDRLADIAFYEPKVSFFTDDGISIPGSSYGQRILRSRPALINSKQLSTGLRKTRSRGARQSRFTIPRTPSVPLRTSPVPSASSTIFAAAPYTRRR